MIIAGIDEAGYGPLLGPLVVSASAVSVPGDVETVISDVETLPNIWSLLRGAVTMKASARKGKLLIADSKAVHNLGDGDKLLERAVLTCLRTVTPAATDCLTLGRLLAMLDCANHDVAAHAWYDIDAALPWAADLGDIAIASNMFTTALRQANVAILHMRTALVTETMFNRMVGATGNKGSALVSLSLRHLYELHQRFGQQGLVVGVDKQGGRDHYTSLLLRSFPEAQLKVLSESDKVSIYLLTEGPRRTLVFFQEKGETHFLPTALASMTCKYLRETCMRSFNQWWGGQLPGLRGTAGYYSDGMRWLADVEPHLPRLAITREHLVRCK